MSWLSAKWEDVLVGQGPRNFQGRNKDDGKDIIPKVCMGFKDDETN